MHIGLDFDNTLACYDQVFSQAAQQEHLLPNGWIGGKRALRDFLRNLKDGESAWQALQGQVYGALMHQAQLKPGVSWFLMHCKARGVKVSIVSHKTEHSPKDPARVPLREKALQWMEQNGFFDPTLYGLTRDNVFFESTRGEKISRISSIRCTHFVDDLPEVFNHRRFPSGVTKILYSPDEMYERVPEAVNICADWSSIQFALLGDESKEDLLVITRALMPSLNVNRCERVTRGGNSKVYKLSRPGHPDLALKRYPIVARDPRDRLGTEVEACRFLLDHGIRTGPSVLHSDQVNQTGVFEWIDGSHITLPDKKDIQDLAAFVSQLDQLRKAGGAQSFAPASEACFSGQAICQQIHSRRDKLGQARIEFPNLRRYFQQEFDPLLAQVQDWVQHHWPHGQAFDDEMPAQFRTLSVSDLGFHNALRDKSGILRIIDLEYFGWDDPVKLASDFCWHPGMALDHRMRNDWIHTMTNIFTRDGLFTARLRAAYPLYGLRWAMIVLNPFLATQNGNTFSVKTLQGQLEKSKALCRRTALWIKDDHHHF
ncbi:MAG: hypothetical protein QGG67_01695 [Gammaproteobacteria bacterium]|jgi:hypothetical protein|nr:hypothetical protein [Gammaproteobacteria bacterium]|tara:strand:+ start:5843 stop:7465 length:1623 start_codon:yes stop_codon:yes gene_type:complete